MFGGQLSVRRSGLGAFNLTTSRDKVMTVYSADHTYQIIGAALELHEELGWGVYAASEEKISLNILSLGRRYDECRWLGHARKNPQRYSWHDPRSAQGREQRR
jgi:hypothetical protein